MDLQPKESLTSKEIEKGLNLVIKDGYISQIMVILITSPFIITFALLLGADIFIVGLISAIPSLCQVFQIISMKMVQNYKNRKRFCVFYLFFYRICIFLIALIPILISFQFALISLIIIILCQSIFAAIGHTAWASWMHDLIPQERLGIFYSRRIMLSTIVTIIISILAGILIQYWFLFSTTPILYAYSLLFLIAFLFGLISIGLISKVPEPKMTEFPINFSLNSMISEPFKDKNYHNLLIFLFIWNFSINFATPFFVVYMLLRLNLDLITILIFTSISQFTNILFLQIWGRLADQFSYKSILSICAPLFLTCILAWIFTTLPNIHSFSYHVLVFIHITMGISQSGIILATNNISIKLAPKGKGNNYLAITKIISSLSLGIAPLIAAILYEYLGFSTFLWELELGLPFALQIRGLDVIFLISFFIGLISLYRLTLIKEIGDVNSKIILQNLFIEIRKSYKNFSSIGGVKSLFLNPSLLKMIPKKYKYKKKRKLKNPKYKKL